MTSAVKSLTYRVRLGPYSHQIWQAVINKRLNNEYFDKRSVTFVTFSLVYNTKNTTLNQSPNVMVGGVAIAGTIVMDELNVAVHNVTNLQKTNVWQ